MSKFAEFRKLCGAVDPRPSLEEARKAAQEEAKLDEGAKPEQIPQDPWMLDKDRFRELALSDEVTEGKKLFEARKKAESSQD